MQAAQDQQPHLRGHGGQTSCCAERRAVHAQRHDQDGQHAGVPARRAPAVHGPVPKVAAEVRYFGRRGDAAGPEEGEGCAAREDACHGRRVARFQHLHRWANTAPVCAWESAAETRRFLSLVGVATSTADLCLSRRGVSWTTEGCGQASLTDTRTPPRRHQARESMRPRLGPTRTTPLQPPHAGCGVCNAKHLHPVRAHV